LRRLHADAKSSRRVGSIAATALAIVLAAAPGPASAQVTEDPQQDAIASARTFFSQFGVAADVQDRLISDYLSGEQWDASSSTSRPTSTRIFDDGVYDYTLRTYPDGSINVVRVERPTSSTGPNEVSTQGIGGCTRVVSGGQDHRNGCKVDFWWGLVSLSFYSSFTYITPGFDRIDSVWGASWSIGGACSTDRNYFGINKKVESSTGPARARLEVQAQMCGVAYTTTFFLQLTVGAGGAKYTYG